LRSGGGPGRGAAPDRDGVPKAEPIPEVDLRERGVRPADQRVSEVAGRAGRALPAPGGAVGRSEGPAGFERAGALGRAAAAAVHCPGAGGRAGDPADGRAGFGAGPDRDGEDRGSDPRAEAALHGHRCHAQHATGRAGLRLHGLSVHGRVGRVWPDAAALHDAAGGAYGGVHHGAGRPTPQRHCQGGLERRESTRARMAGVAEGMGRLAVEALLERDREKAEQVIRRDEEVNALELEIDDAAIQLLALQQPMARDLRFITMVMKISNDVERVGDHAVNIAEDVEYLLQGPPFAPLPEIEEMARLCRAMLSDALDAFVRGDSELAREV